MSINCCTKFTRPMTSRPPKVNTYADFGPPGMPDAPIGAIYVDKHTNKMWMLNSEKKWIHMANYSDYTASAEKGNKNVTNCRNYGAPVYGYKCEYCNTHY